MGETTMCASGVFVPVGLQRGGESGPTAEGSCNGPVHPSQGPATVWGGLSGRACELHTTMCMSYMCRTIPHAPITMYCPYSVHTYIVIMRAKFKFHSFHFSQE